MRRYNIDDYVIGSYGVHYDYDTKKFNIGSPTRLRTFETQMNKICSGHDFIRDGTMLLTTCEGFNSELNLNTIVRILRDHYGIGYSKKVIFDQGSLTFHKKSMMQNGVWIVPNAAFTYNECKLQFLKNVPDINYNRQMNKMFCSLYARNAYDRSRIFDHMIRNHYDNSDLIYSGATVCYDDLPYYIAENHINTKYNNVYNNIDSEYKSDDTARYILDDMQYRANECFLNIISETNYYEDNSCFITEKTVTSMLSGFPFITSTSVGYYDILKDLGFKTFSNFWDESFNSITNHEARTDALLENIDEIAKQYSTIESRKNTIELMRPILEHNRNRWIEIWNKEEMDYLEPLGYSKILRTISSSLQDSPY